MYQAFKLDSLHNAIESIWYEDSAEPVKHYEVTPELNANLIIKIYANQCEVVCSGAVTHYKTYPYIPNAHYFGIRFHPGYICFGQSANLYELQNQSIIAPQQFLYNWNHLEERIQDINCLKDQITELSLYLNKLMINIPTLPDSIKELLHYIQSHQGMLTVRELAHLTMRSERQLERLCKEYLGLSPKMVCDIVRIRHVLNILWQSPQEVTLSEIALQFGYVDQSHLAKNFKRFMGKSISEYLTS